MLRETLKKQLKTDGIAIAVLGGILLILDIPLLAIMLIASIVYADWNYINIILIAMSGLVSLLGIFLTYFGATLSNFNKSLLIKKYNDILELIDDLDANVLYANEDIIISEKAVASKNHLSSVVKREDVFLIYDLIEKNKKYFYGKHVYIKAFVKQNLARIIMNNSGLGRFVCGFFANRAGDKIMIRIGQGIVVLGCLLIILPLPTFVSILGILVIGIGCAPIYPSLLHETPDNFGPEKSQAIMGVQMACAYIGTTLVPPLFGFFSGLISLKLYPYFIFVIIALQIAMVELINKRKPVEQVSL